MIYSYYKRNHLPQGLFDFQKKITALSNFKCHTKNTSVFLHFYLTVCILYALSVYHMTAGHIGVKSKSIMLSSECKKFFIPIMSENTYQAKLDLHTRHYIYRGGYFETWSELPGVASRLFLDKACV